ncbi:MAG: hypothetical protein ACREFE_07665, partial [Limisphaerales bacterium]
MKRKEIAKNLFIRYCEFYKFNCKEIEESKLHGVRTPNLEISANGVKIIVEAKNLNANDEEIRCWRETRSGKIVVHGREPGKRARSLIEDARGQLRPYAEAGTPSIVVLYDNILVDGTRPGPAIDWLGPLGPNDIDMALYGLWKANIRLHPDGTTESLGDTRSKWRRIHDRQIISAVCVIYEHPENESLFTIAYHNYWAIAPLPKNIFIGKDDRHLAKVSDPDVQPDS